MADTIPSLRSSLAALVGATALCLVGFTLPASAQGTTGTGDATVTPPPVAASGSFMWDLVAVVVPLLLVIAGLFAVLYFARRRYKLTGRDAALSIVQVLPVGPRERVVVLRTRADRVFAIGVGPQSLNLIAELDAADVAVDSPGDDGQKPPLSYR